MFDVLASFTIILSNRMSILNVGRLNSEGLYLTECTWRQLSSRYNRQNKKKKLVAVALIVIVIAIVISAYFALVK